MLITRDNIYEKLEELSREINNISNIKSYIRTSNRGVPHVVVNCGNIKYSICYFLSSKTFTIYYDYGEFETIQKRLRIETTEKVIQFFKNLRKGELNG